MNPVEKAIRKLDVTQQRYRPTAFVFGVVKKYGDDNGGVLASNLAYSAFVSIFPLLLILTTILGLVASVSPSVRTQVLNAVAGQVPLIGQTLTGNVHQLQRSSIIGLIIGFVGLIWGASGLAQAGLFTMAQVWNLPGPARPGYVQRLGRAMLFIALLGGGVVVTTGLASLNTYVLKGFWAVILAELLAVAFNTGMYVGAFRALTPKGVPTRKLLPGAITGGICWTVLQVLGTWLVHHFLHSDSLYGVFGTVLGLLAWIYLAVEVTVYSRRDQRGAGAAAVAAVHRPAAADRGRPGQHGPAGAAEPAAPRAARRGDLRRPGTRRAGACRNPADARGGRTARGRPDSRAAWRERAGFRPRHRRSGAAQCDRAQ